jgi:homoserine kinase
MQITNRMKSVKAFAPATVANVCCGFDILGFAVDAPGDEVKVTLTKRL